MSIAQAEKLKTELTDKWVVVADQVPELKRFADLTGKVKTVNMNCRALVEFNGPEDIGWYDIDPQFLTVVDKPLEKKEAAPAAKTSPKSPAAPPKIPAAGGGSPLDQIRAGGAASPAKPAGGSPLDQIRAAGGGSSAPASGGSPLDQIRASAAPASEEKTPAETPEATKKDESDTKPAAPVGNPLDAIRAQGGFKG